MEQIIILLANPWLASLAIIVGFVLLIYGADWLVDGASAVAKQLGVSDLVIGLTVVAFGTSMPELIVSLLAAAQHNTELAITNVLGSNAINTCIILGLTALIYPVASQISSRKFDIPFSLLAGLLVLFFAIYTKPTTTGWGEIGAFSIHGGFISGIGGVVLLLCFVLFLWHSFRVAKQEDASTTDSSTQQLTTSPSRLIRPILLIIVGLIGLVLGGEAIVRSATSIAHLLGVSDAIIGLTIVALGTSLPELATSCVAAAKHNSDLALGNVIGSNIFNIFLILGLSAVIQPLPAYSGLWLDALIVSLSALLVWMFVSFNPHHQVRRWHGATLVLIYTAYLTYRIITL